MDENTMQAAIAPQNPEVQLTVKHRPLTLEELQAIGVPCRIYDGFMVVEKSATGFSLRNPVKVQLERVQSLDKGSAAYILQSFVSTRPILIPFVLENQSVIRMAKHFLRF